MEIKRIKELIAVMEKGGLSRIHIKEKNGSEITLEKEGHINDYHSSGHKHTFHHPSPSQLLPTQETHQKDKQEEPKGRFIHSPMVGTFYTAPSPNDPAYVKVGDRVEKGAIVCIVEAMKVMNEVKADQSGVIQEILVDNMQPVEFGTKLFRIE